MEMMKIRFNKINAVDKRIRLIDIKIESIDRRIENINYKIENIKPTDTTEFSDMERMVDIKNKLMNLSLNNTN